MESVGLNRLQILDEDELTLLLATPTPTGLSGPSKRQNKQFKVKPRESHIQIKATPQPIIPQKRQKMLEEIESVYEFSGSSGSSAFSPALSLSPSLIPNTPASSFNADGMVDIKAIIQNAISPLITEVKKLKEEIKQLQLQKLTASTKTVNAEAKEMSNAIRQPQPGKAKAAEAKRPTYANIAAGEPIQVPEKADKPWIIIQKKKPVPTAELTPKKATEPSQRRIIFQRQKNAIQNTNLPNLLLALNKAMKEWGLPDHIRLIKLGYTGAGAISGLLAEKATAAMLIPRFSDALIKIAIQHDMNIIGLDQAEEWYKLRVHRVQLKRYFDSPNGLKLAREEIEATHGLNMPLAPQWLANKEVIKQRYRDREINFSTIIITVRNKLEANKLTAKGLYFGGCSHTVDRYWETGPEEICPKCLEYGHTSYRGCSRPPKCYICAGDHEAKDHKCPITGCSTLAGRACIHLPIKCIHCKGPHLATSNSCPKKRTAIEEAKRKKEDAKRLKESRKRIQVVIPRKQNVENAHISTTANTDTQMEGLVLDGQAEAQLQAQLNPQC